jgi:hypothetical protein
MRKRNRMYLIDARKQRGGAIYRSRLPYNAELRLWLALILWLDETFTAGKMICPRNVDFFVPSES